MNTPTYHALTRGRDESVGKMKFTHLHFRTEGTVETENSSNYIWRTILKLVKAYFEQNCRHSFDLPLLHAGEEKRCIIKILFYPNRFYYPPKFIASLNAPTNIFTIRAKNWLSKNSVINLSYFFIINYQDLRINTSFG